MNDRQRKPLTGSCEIHNVIRYQSVCCTVDCCLKNHFIVRIPNLRSPLKMYLCRFDQCGKFRQKLINPFQQQTVSKSLLRTL